MDQKLFLVSAGEVGFQYACDCRYGHGLEYYPTGTGNDGIEKTFSTEKCVFEAFDRDYVHLTGGVHCGKITGVYDHLLSFGKIIFDSVSVYFDESYALSGKLLHDEAFASEQACSEFLAEVRGKGGRWIAEQVFGTKKEK